MFYNTINKITDGGNVISETDITQYIVEFHKCASEAYVHDWCMEHVFPYSDGNVIKSITRIPPSIDDITSDKQTSLWKIEICWEVEYV